MWAKFKIIEPIDYVLGELIKNHVAVEDEKIWTRIYKVTVNSELIPRLIKLKSKKLGNCSEHIIEFLVTEDQGNIQEPPCTRALTNLDTEDCIISFYYEDPGVDVYYADEGLVNVHHTDLRLNQTVTLAPNETILIDATLPTRVEHGKLILWRTWKQDFKLVENEFRPWLKCGHWQIN